MPPIELKRNRAASREPKIERPVKTVLVEPSELLQGFAPGSPAMVKVERALSQATTDRDFSSEVRALRLLILKEPSPIAFLRALYVADPKELAHFRLPSEIKPELRKQAAEVLAKLAFNAAPEPVTTETVKYTFSLPAPE